MKKYVDKDALQEFTTKLTGKYKTMFSSPLVASTVAGMTDTEKVYVYVGSETGYTNGNWYYYNGSAWVSGGVYNAVAVDTDTTLAISGKAADAKKTGDEIADLKSAISGGVGIPSDVKEALLDCIAHIGAWSDGNGQAYYDALEAALYPPAELVSISAVYTQTGNVYPDDSLDSLKDDLVVTAHYDDQSTSTITTYTLSGTLAEGTSTVTVSYSGKTTTFTVTVSAQPQAHTISYANGDFSYVNSDSVSAAYDENGTDITSEFTGGTLHFYQTDAVNSNVTMTVNITTTMVYRKTFAGSYDRATKTVRNAVVISNNPTRTGDYNFTVDVLQGQSLGIFNFSGIANITAAEATWME